MRELLTAAQMREVEQGAIRSGRVTGLELMERAGRGVVAAILDRWPVLDRRGASPSRSPGYFRPDEGDPLRAVVLCGPGNNGGDGFVIARVLRELGWEVDLFLYGDPDRLPPDARANYETVQGEIKVQDWALFRPGEGAPCDLYVDAVFGAGLSRAPGADVMRPLVKLADAAGQGGRVVCVDAPTGLCMDSGRALSVDFGAVRGDLTVTFHRKRPGQFLQDGPAYCGDLRVVDIGLEGDGAGAVSLLGRAALPDLGKTGFGHKYSHGHALVVSGGEAQTGAARLAARAALRVGAGLVTVGAPGAALGEVASQVTAIMVRRVGGPEELAETLEDQRLNALCLGPGLGVRRARDLVPVALASGRPAVLDADALSAFAEDQSALFDRLHGACVLTPHGGEFARLFPDIAARLADTPVTGPAYSRVDAAREAARRAGCVVLFKGPDTVIAGPDGRCSINAASYDRAVPWLATAGAGDVLAGLITGLLARGYDPMRSAEAGAWLHVESARVFGAGLIAEDISEQVPGVLNALRTPAG